jgi:hypothetical protein
MRPPLAAWSRPGAQQRRHFGGARARRASGRAGLRPCRRASTSRAAPRARRRPAAVLARDVAALEAAVQHMACSGLRRSTAASACAQAGAQLVPPTVPRFMCGSVPSNSQGSSLLMLWPSNSTAWPCCAFSAPVRRPARRGRAASRSGHALLHLGFVGRLAVAVDRLAGEEARRAQLGVVAAGVHRLVVAAAGSGRPRSGCSAAPAGWRPGRRRRRTAGRGTSRCLPPASARSV